MHSKKYLFNLVTKRQYEEGVIEIKWVAYPNIQFSNSLIRLDNALVQLINFSCFICISIIFSVFINFYIIDKI